LAFATIEDIEARWRPLTQSEAVNADAWLNDAAVLIRRRVPNITDRLEDDDYAQTVTSINAAMVLRVLRNPEGLRQVSVGDASYTRDQALSAGALYLTKDEADQLGAVSGAGRAFTVIPHDESDAVSVYDHWIPLDEVEV
jgi:hypothetical protein